VGVAPIGEAGQSPGPGPVPRRGEWPYVHILDWCGEFNAAEMTVWLEEDPEETPPSC
jgi:hypothetical protein